MTRPVYRLTIHSDPRYLLNRDYVEVGERVGNYEIARLFNKELLPKAHHTVVATMDGVRVGFFRFTLNDGQANALGTFVERGHRRRGLATMMWRHAIEELDIERIYVVATSEAGAAFTQSIAASDLGDVFLERRVSGILDPFESTC